MKTAFIFLLFCGYCFGQNLKTVTFNDLETIQKVDPKPVIIHFYTDWCAVCKIESFKMKKDADLVKFINENFYYINFEAEKTKEKVSFQGKDFHYLPNGNSGIHELALAFSKNKNQPVYPLWIILNQNQELLYYHEGKYAPAQLKNDLREILKKSVDIHDNSYNP